MTNQETENINRLIETGEPDNLSLAYHFLLSWMSEVEAVLYIIRKHSKTRLAFRGCVLLVSEFEYFNTSILGIYDNCSVELFYSAPHQFKTLREALDQTKSIWQGKI